MTAQALSASLIRPLPAEPEEWQIRMEMLASARSFIYASMYFLQHDAYGQPYIAALEKARARGVSVNLLIDGFGQKLAGALMTPQQKQDIRLAVARLRAKGAQVVFYRCPRRLQRLLGSGMHIKIQLTEHGGALFSSGNISFTSYEKWCEFSTYLEGAVVPRLLRELPPYGLHVDDAHQRHLESLPAAENHRFDYLSHDPTRDTHPLNPFRLASPNALTDFIIQRIDAARSSLSLTSLYYKPAPALAAAVLRAARRGVRVEIFHCHRDALGPSVIPWIPAYLHYPALLEAGVHIYENPKGEHAKIVLIDDKEALWGSYNLEYAAHDRLAEAMMLSREEPMVAALRHVFDERRSNPDNIRIENTALPPALARKVRLFRPIERWI